ncbi:MAG: AMP-dependent synthetase [Geobacteraceae bacterium GWC2_58_44]|nr:MAG: AMP-dependent synthetase [Geobacteraceae bacterium GWC2_58_44]HBG05654.1 AMP-dependent synthetase [Geobacter sp.]
MQTIDSLMRSRCETFADRTALRQKVAGAWQETSYRGLWNSSGLIASALYGRGFRPGDHAALLAPSSTRWVASYLGILRAGGVVIPVDKELKSAELRHILSDCGARIIFTDSSCLDTLLESVPSLPELQSVILLHSSKQHGDPGTGKALEALLDEWHELVASLGIPADRVARMEILAGQVHRLLSKRNSRSELPEGQDLLSPTFAIRAAMTRERRILTLDSMQHGSSPPPSPRSATDTAVILYTSGTTGRSKGAMLSHGNIVSNLQGTACHFNLDETIHTLSFLPINHVFEQVAGVLLPLSLGGRVSFAESLKKLGENLAEVKPTFLLGVPAVYKMILERIGKNVAGKKLSQILFSIPVTRPLVTSKVKKAFGAGTIFISGGAALDPEIAKGLLSFGITVYQGYGITETSPVISAECPRGKRLGTVGRLLPEVQVRIDNPNEDQIGEIVVKGPNVMQGYYNMPEATAEVLEEGWYRTGDLGRLDPDGYLSICGRLKNLIVTPNGKNVYPEEVENKLLKSRFIAEAMVYGYRVGPMAEEVHAVIHPNQEELDSYALGSGMKGMTLADVERLIRDEVLAAGKELADYKRVKRFTLREDEFPKTTTRKIKRFAVEATISMSP